MILSSKTFTQWAGLAEALLCLFPPLLVFFGQEVPNTVGRHACDALGGGAD
jgi:hypothetical protein